MNSKKSIQKLREGKQPINKEMVRDMLQNRTYLGEVCHCDTQYSGSLGEGKKSSRKRKVWGPGNHPGFISQDLFDQCQKVRANLALTHKSESVMRTYVLHDQSNLVIPKGLKEWVEHAVRSRIENEAAFRRIAEIEEVIKRVDLRWEEGFMNKEEYVEKRRQLKQELDSLRPVDYDELAEAEDLLSNFRVYWQECTAQANPAEARRQLLDKIVERVFVHNRQVLALVIHGSFGIILNQNEPTPTQVVDAVQQVLINYSTTLKLGDSKHESDGVGTRAGLVLILAFDHLITRTMVGIVAKRTA